MVMYLYRRILKLLLKKCHIWKCEHMNQLTLRKKKRKIHT